MFRCLGVRREGLGGGACTAAASLTAATTTTRPCSLPPLVPLPSLPPPFSLPSHRYVFLVYAQPAGARAPAAAAAPPQRARFDAAAWAARHIGGGDAPAAPVAATFFLAAPE